MENQNFILKLSRLFPSSFSSCQLRTVTADVADSSISITKIKKIPHHDNDRLKPSKVLKSPRASSPVPSLNLKKNRSSEIRSRNNNHVSSSSNSGFFSSSDDEKVKKDAETDTFFSLSSNSGDSFRLKSTSRRFKRGEEVTTKMKTINEKERSSFDVSSKNGGDMKNNCGNNTTKKCSNKRQENNWYSVSDHHAYYYSNKKVSDINNARNRVRRARIKKRSLRPGSMLIEESRAVEKRSVDPRSDFRASMVEMIVEKQMVSARDLERLLLCFLSLNDVSYHEMIFEVFSEICETLFNN